LTGCSTGAIRPGYGIVDCAGSCGTSGQVLMSDGTNAICWATSAGGSSATPISLGLVYGCVPATVAGGYNTAIGVTALYCNTTGLHNVAFGYQTLYFANSCRNSAFGYRALKYNTSGDNNNAIGWQALSDNTTGSNSIAVGTQALQKNTTGSANVAVGVGAMYCNSTGSCNIAIGNSAIERNTTGARNIAIGQESLQLNTTGTDNVAIGFETLLCSPTGCFNTVIGTCAARGNSGNYNVVIGANACTSSTTINNQVSLYNGTTYARLTGSTLSWAFVSDARDKRNIENLPLGLEFIESLQPRKFEWDHRHTDADQGRPASGFIAQEVLEVVEANDAGYANLVDTDNPDQYTFSQANLVPILVNAVKELAAEVKLLKAEVAELKNS